MRLEPVIGLEIHVQLKTRSKMFCGCRNGGDQDPPNTNVCPICLGHPGTLPVVNARAVEFAVLVGKAFGARITERSKFDRKNYFYPDLPKGYQISQFDLSVVAEGALTVSVPDENGGRRDMKVGITRAHLEEDAAKLHHAGVGEGKASLVDFNRGGAPLLEIVTEPDMRTPAEAKAFLQELRLMMRYLDVSHADMEKGQMRCDVNISLREVADDGVRGPFHPKTEIKNVNSFRSVERAIDHEIKRQTKLWLDGAPPAATTTRGWDDARGITIEQRAKEDAADYRYFPEPDIPPLDLHDLAERMSSSVPELPEARRVRFMEEYGLSGPEARTFCDDKDLADYAEKVFSELEEWASSNAGSGAEPLTKERRAKLVSGWLLTKLQGILSTNKMDIRTIKIGPEDLAELLGMIHANKVTGPNALVILEEMAKTGADPSVILEDKNLGQMDDAGELMNVVKNVIAQNGKVVQDYLGGKETAVQFLVGQVMKLSRGKAPPEKAREALIAELETLK